MAKILVIENQYSHFVAIQKHLRKKLKYVVHPSEAEKVFIDHVRIFLNVRYKDDRRGSSRQFIMDYLDKHKFDLFIIDHKLVGAFDGSNGIDLAEELRECESEFINTVPIIFLSASRTNEQSVKDYKHKISNSEWVEKGYAGKGIDDDQYFDIHVRPKIETLLNKTRNIILSKGQELIETGKFSFTSELHLFLGEIKSDNRKVKFEDFLACYEKLMHASTDKEAKAIWRAIYER